MARTLSKTCQDGMMRFRPGGRLFTLTKNPHERSPMARSSYERDLDRDAANFQPLTPLTFRGGVSGTPGDRPWTPQAKLPRLPRSLEEARVRAGEARLRRRRHGRGHARQYACDARMPLRRTNVRRGSQYAQHPPRCGRCRLHPRPRRGEGDERRPRIRAHDRRRLEARQGAPARRRLR